MTSLISGLCTLSLLIGFWPAALPQEQASLATFVGTWVGTQSWAMDEPSPSAKEPQAVTLTIELVNGRLVGSMPIFGGADVAKFTDTKIVGDELVASAIIEKPKNATAEDGAPQRAAPKAWTDQVKVTFHLKADKTNLTGTADLLMGDVKWLKFKYDLGKKRSRY